MQKFVLLFDSEIDLNPYASVLVQKIWTPVKISYSFSSFKAHLLNICYHHQKKRHTIVVRRCFQEHGTLVFRWLSNFWFQELLSFFLSLFLFEIFLYHVQIKLLPAMNERVCIDVEHV